jgi:hypothetical protein
MRRRGYWMKLSFLAFVVSAALVLFTAFFQNNALAMFPTHDYGGENGFVRCVGYDLPFAFREKVSLIDTSSTQYHWGYLLLNVCFIATIVLLLLHLMVRARWMEINEA